MRSGAVVFLTIVSLQLVTGAISAFAADSIVIKGSDTMGARLVPQLAEAFRRFNPAVSFEISSEGSGTGLASLFDGTADVAMSSREIRETEILEAERRGISLVKVAIAFDGIAIVVNDRNPVDDLDERLVERIFCGDLRDWGALEGKGGSISVYTRNASSGTYVAFQELAMRQRDYGRMNQRLAGNEQIADEVASNPLGIGYVGLAYMDLPGLKVLSINGHEPDPLAVSTGVYPYARPLFFVLRASPEREVVDQFVDFALSPMGQRLVAAVQFVPVGEP